MSAADKCPNCDGPGWYIYNIKGDTFNPSVCRITEIDIKDGIFCLVDGGEGRMCNYVFAPCPKPEGWKE